VPWRLYVFLCLSVHLLLRLSVSRIMHKVFLAVFTKPCSIMAYCQGRNSSMLGLVLVKLADWQTFGTLLVLTTRAYVVRYSDALQLGR